MASAHDRQEGGDHYKHLGIEVWTVIDAWKCGFYEGNVLKYLARFRIATMGETATGLPKGGLIDLKKAKHYLEKLIELEEAKPSEEQRRRELEILKP